MTGNAENTRRTLQAVNLYPTAKGIEAMQNATDQASAKASIIEAMDKLSAGDLLAVLHLTWLLGGAAA